MSSEKTVGRLLILGSVLAASAGWGAAPRIGLDEALRSAELGNPRIRAARAEWDAAKQETRLARAIPQPVLGLGIMPSDMRIHTARGPMSRRYTAEQKIPFPGKRGMAGRQARAKAKMAEANYRAVQLDVRAETTDACARLYYIDRSIAATEEQEELVRRFVLVAERKYSTGRHPQSDVYRAQVEQAKLGNRLVTLRGEKVTAQARLNALLGRNSAEPVGDPILEKEPFDFSLEMLKEKALAGNPVILMRQADVARLKAARKTARLMYFPDFALGYEYTQIEEMEGMAAADGTDAQSFIFKVELPIWFGPTVAANRGARHALESARAEEENAGNETRAEVVALAVEARTHLRLAELFENTLIPLAEGTLASTQKGYEADQAEFLELLDSQRSLLDIKLEYHQHLSEYWTVRSRLERLVGGPLTNMGGGE